MWNWIESIVDFPKREGSIADYYCMISFFSAYVTKGDNISSPKFIKDSINKFWIDEVYQIPSDSKILITLRVNIQGENKTEDLKTISNLMKVDINEKQRVIDYFTGRMMLKTTEYKPSNFTARTVSTKITRAMKNASVQQSAIESKAKDAATTIIKNKTSEAIKTLKLPTDHVWWSLWLMQNSIKSLVRAYQLWIVNMNKYAIFRFISALLGYIVWPIQKAIQILAYFKFVRMFLLIIGFFIGLFTDAKVFKFTLTEYTTLLALNVDYFFLNSIAKLTNLLNYLRELVLDNMLDNADKVKSNEAFPAMEIIETPLSTEDSWWDRNKVYVFIGVTVASLAFIAYLALSGNSDSPSNTTVPSGILKGKGPVLDSTIMEVAKNKTVRFQNSSYGLFQSALDYGKIGKDNILDAVDRLKTGNFSGFMDTNTSTKLAEIKQAADASVQGGSSSFPDPDSTPGFKLTNSSSSVNPNIPIVETVSNISIPRLSVMEIKAQLCQLPYFEDLQSVVKAGIDALNPGQLYELEKILHELSNNTNVNHQDLAHKAKMLILDPQNLESSTIADKVASTVIDNPMVNDGSSTVMDNVSSPILDKASSPVMEAPSTPILSNSNLPTPDNTPVKDAVKLVVDSVSRPVSPAESISSVVSSSSTVTPSSYISQLPGFNTLNTVEQRALENVHQGELKSLMEIGKVLGDEVGLGLIQPDDPKVLDFAAKIKEILPADSVSSPSITSNVLSNTSSTNTLNPNASSFIPSSSGSSLLSRLGSMQAPNPDDYLVDQYKVIPRISPQLSANGTLGFYKWEEVHSKIAFQQIEPNGTTKNILQETIRKRFF